MHNNRITIQDIANVTGYTKGYICAILNCRRKPPNAEAILNNAVEKIIADRKQVE